MSEVLVLKPHTVEAELAVTANRQLIGGLASSRPLVGMKVCLMLQFRDLVAYEVLQHLSATQGPAAAAMHLY